MKDDTEEKISKTWYIQWYKCEVMLQMQVVQGGGRIVLFGDSCGYDDGIVSETIG